MNFLRSSVVSVLLLGRDRSEEEIEIICFIDVRHQFYIVIEIVLGDVISESHLVENDLSVCFTVVGDALSVTGDGFIDESVEDETAHRRSREHPRFGIFG